MPPPRAAPRSGQLRRLLSRRSTLRCFGAGLAAAALVPGAARSVAAQAGTPAPADGTPFPPEQQRALEAVVAKRLAEQAIPGAVVGAWVPGRGTWVHAAGVGDLGTGTPIAADDRFRIASVTKTFTATVVLQLVDEGRLSLDDRLEPFVSGIPNGDRITIEQVLGMTAGVYNYVEDPAFTAAYDANPLMPFTPADVLAIVRAHPPDFAPGEGLNYSDTNYVLLGLIIEQLTRQAVGAAITERVIVPLSLAGTRYPTTPEMPDPHARGYATDRDGTGLRDVTRSNPDVTGPAGAMISTLADLRTWAKALADGTLLRPETQRERLRWSPLPAAPGFDVAYGLGVMELNGFVGHNGSIFGYSTWMMHLPKHDATIVVLTNRAETETETAGGIFLDLVRFLFPARFPAAAGTPVAGTPAP